MRETIGRALMLLGLAVTGMALFVGVFGGHPYLMQRLGGPIRAELTILALGAALFFIGTAVGGVRR
jgi:cytochrome b subunit of formate dehydrogenase